MRSTQLRDLLPAARDGDLRATMDLIEQCHIETVGELVRFVHGTRVPSTAHFDSCADAIHAVRALADAKA